MLLYVLLSCLYFLLDCLHSCSSKAALTAHLKRHAVKDSRAVLFCPDPHCPLTFSTKSWLIKHVQAHHPKIVEAQYTKGEVFITAWGVESYIECVALWYQRSVQNNQTCPENYIKS